MAPERLPIQNGTLAWFLVHRQGISATDAPVVLGVSSSVTPWQLWKAKTERDLVGLSALEAEHSRRADWDTTTFGVRPIFLMLYTSLTGRYARRESGLLRSRTRPWMLASVDARVAGGRRIIVVEEGLYYPLAPLKVQIQHSLEVSGSDVADVIVLGEIEPRVAEVPRDEGLIAEIVAVEAVLWRAVEAGRWPPPGLRSRWAGLVPRQPKTGAGHHQKVPHLRNGRG